MPDKPNHTQKPAISPTPSSDDGIALASLILGITSVTFMGPITGIPAIILGVMSLKNTTHRGYSITGIITGSISILLTILLVIFFVFLIALGGAFSSDIQLQDEGHTVPPSQTFQQL